MIEIVDGHHHIWRQANLPWLTGPMQPGFSALPSTFTYTVLSGTGRFQGLHSTGTVQLTLSTPVTAPHAHPHGTFAITFGITS